MSIGIGCIGSRPLCRLQKNKFWVHNIYTNEKNTTDLSAGENISKTDYLTDSDSSMLTQALSNVKFSKDVTFTQSERDSLPNENRELRNRNRTQGRFSCVEIITVEPSLCVTIYITKINSIMQ